MKATELQLGDYVNYRGQIIKVTSLYDKGGSNEVGWSDKESVWVNGRCIEPIPLTPEILENNEFTRDPLWHHCDKDFGNYTISVQLGYANKIEYIKIYEKGKDDVVPSERTKLYLTHIKYVHQLQQALRLCGIKEIIEL